MSPKRILPGLPSDGNVNGSLDSEDVQNESLSAVKRHRILPEPEDLETPTLPEDVKGLDGLDRYAAEWFADCFRMPVTKCSPNVIFKGRKSFAWLVPKLTSSFIYPFYLIKPCGVHGDMTLKDVNQKIRTPAAKPNEDKADHLVFQTSAFSGKPVVGKTKFRTEGGRGRITIMRTGG
ncbi:hypothetical protein N665_0751s0012 [Sinapis alba]|nr:hypothetical protein N665_0751s0012 [Sinapis alba]